MEVGQSRALKPVAFAELGAMRKWERVCTHPEDGRQALFLRCSQGRVNLEENGREWGPPWAL